MRDLIGKRFSKLRVIRFSHMQYPAEGSNGHKTAVWVCRCECGGERLVSSRALSSKSTKACAECSRKSCRGAALSPYELNWKFYLSKFTRDEMRWFIHELNRKDRSGVTVNKRTAAELVDVIMRERRLPKAEGVNRFEQRSYRYISDRAVVA